MFDKSRLALAGLLFTVAAVAGCRSGSHCRDGSCGAPRHAPSAAAPTYAPADGSGSRAPVMLPPSGGSGSRGEGSGSR